MIEESSRGEIFQIPARRCRRCGGLLTSEEALRDGVGHVCKLREKEEADARRWEEENQYSLFTPPNNRSGPPGAKPGGPRGKNQT